MICSFRRKAFHTCIQIATRHGLPEGRAVTLWAEDSSSFSLKFLFSIEKISEKVLSSVLTHSTIISYQIIRENFPNNVSNIGKLLKSCVKHYTMQYTWFLGLNMDLQLLNCSEWYFCLLFWFMLVLGFSSLDLFVNLFLLLFLPVQELIKCWNCNLNAM